MTCLLKFRRNLYAHKFSSQTSLIFIEYLNSETVIVVARVRLINMGLYDRLSLCCVSPPCLALPVSLHSIKIHYSDVLCVYI